jgi:hypothetical protein
MPTETYSEDTLGARREGASEYVRLVVGGVARLDPYPHLVLSGHNLHPRGVCGMHSAKPSERLLLRLLQFSMKHGLIIDPNRNRALFESTLNLNGDNCGAIRYFRYTRRTNPGRSSRRSD